MTEKKKTQSPKGTTHGVAPVKPAPKPTPKATVPAPTKKPAPKSETISAIGLYQIKSTVGALNIRAIPIPGNRVLIVLPGSSKIIENLSIVKTGEVYSLK